MGRRLGMGLALLGGIAIGLAGGLSFAPERIAAHAAADAGATIKRLEAQVAANTAEIRKINQQLVRVGTQTKSLQAATRKIATSSGVQIQLVD